MAINKLKLFVRQQENMKFSFPEREEGTLSRSTIEFVSVCLGNTALLLLDRCPTLRRKQPAVGRRSRK